MPVLSNYGNWSNIEQDWDVLMSLGSEIIPELTTYGMSTVALTLFWEELLQRYSNWVDIAQ